MKDEFITFFNTNFTFNKPYREKEYKIKPIGSNKYVSPQEVFSRYSSVLNSMGKTVDVTVDEVVQYTKEHTPIDQQEERKPCRTWIYEWLDAHKDNWTFNTGWTSITYVYNGIPRNKTLEDLKAALMEDVYQYQLAYKTEEVKTTLDCIARDKSSMAAAAIFEKIAYNAAMVDPCDRFLHGLYDFLKPEESYEIWKTLMMHWGWELKRRMLGLEVVWHIWINLFGSTGLGKTTLLKKLCSPMADYTTVTNISMLFDSTREIAKLSEYYVLIFDELAVNVEGEPGGNLTEDNKSTLKSILTADYLDVRVYGTQRQSKQKITFVPISSANNHLYDIIFDPTSMRRFFEFHCTAERPKSFDGINKYLEHSDVYWKGINENLDRGYWDPNSEVGKEISRIQASYYPTRTTTSMWIDACHVIAGNTSGMNAYKAYCNWCRETGNKQKTMQNFIKDIAHMLPDAMDESGKAHLHWLDEEENLTIYRQSSAHIADDIDILMGVHDDEDAA